LEKVACGAFSDISFGPAAKGATFAACIPPLEGFDTHEYRR
jgi:hypothetical protein